MSIVKFQTRFVAEQSPHQWMAKEIVACCQVLARYGCAPGTSGNVSVRTPHGFLVTAANISFATLREEECVEVLDLARKGDAMFVEARGRFEPSSESPLHWYLYTRRPDTHAVLHLHDDAILRAAATIGIPATAEKATSGTMTIVQKVEELLDRVGDVDAFVLAGHGTIVVGSSLQEALKRALALHEQAVAGAKKEMAMERDDRFRPEFEDNDVGRIKAEVWDATDAKIDAILAEYGVPSAGEFEKPGCYLQMTHPAEQEEKRRANDIVLVPLGSTELHGPHGVGAQDTLQVTRLCEAIRRYTAKQGREVNLAWPPWLYGNHPKHHVGLIGTIPVSATVLRQQLVDVIFGLWSQGYRKIIFVNNHAQHWIIAQAIDDFLLRYPELSAFMVAFDWCCAMSEFFRTKDRGGPFEDDFVHGDETETSLALLLAPEMVDMSRAVDTKVRAYLPDGHFNKSAAQRSRPNLWWSVRNNVPLEAIAQPEGVLGRATLASAEKAKRPVAAALRYLTLLVEHILETFPPGTVPPIEEVTLFTEEEIGGYHKKLGEKGYKNPYRLWQPYD